MIDLERLVYGPIALNKDNVSDQEGRDLDEDEGIETGEGRIYMDSSPLRPREAAGFYMRRKGLLD
ncbi:MAG: hypothetical protein AAB478_04595 [Patescibacteria group bacterium]